MSTATSIADGKMARVIKQLEKLKVSWDSRVKVADSDVVDISDEECEEPVQKAVLSTLKRAMEVQTKSEKTEVTAAASSDAAASMDELPPQAPLIKMQMQIGYVGFVVCL